MGINEKGEFVRDGVVNENPAPKTPEQLEWERREALKLEVRKRRENEESLEGIPEDIIAEVLEEGKQAAERRKQLREKFKNNTA